MLSRLNFRSAAVVAAAAFVLAACGEGTTLPTTIDPVEMEADVAALEAGFESPATESFVSIGYAIDGTIAGSGGAVLRLPAMMVEEGPVAPAMRFRDRFLTEMTDDMASSIPLSALGKTFVYDIDLDAYVVSELTGAPADGVRFLLYSIDAETGLVIEPLVQVGWVDITRTATESTLTGRIEIYVTGGTKVMDYSATLGGTAVAPTFAVTGFAGVGVNRVDFSLTTGISLSTGAVTITWQTDVAARNLRSRVQLAISGGDYPTATIGAVLRAGVRKVEIAGTIDFFAGGELIVEVGDRIFAIITIGEVDVTITDENGDPLSPEDEETLMRIFEWFEGTFGVPDALLAPLWTVLDVGEGA